jgi:hypothetical protein
VTVAAAKARSYASAVKGSLGWAASCSQCNWSQPPDTRRYHSDAAFQARAHNAEHHAKALKGGVK